MEQPLVSIIVVSHNHRNFIQEAIESVVNQTYTNTELLIVDDGSTDGTDDIIRQLENSGLPIQDTLLLEDNIGYCSAFNQVYSRSEGKYIIDLSGDDVLLPDRVKSGVAALQSNHAGVDFCDAFYIDQHSEIIGTHYLRDSKGELKQQVKDGDVFTEILKRYFICTPTMFFDREVLDHLGGYDETLYYEDFDLWVRSARVYNYHYTDRILVKKRVLQKSMSKSQYSSESNMLPTTLRVCEKAFKLCKHPEEYRALVSRIRYEMRQSLITGNYQVAEGFNKLLKATKKGGFEPSFWGWLIAKEPNLQFLTRFMGKAR